MISTSFIGNLCSEPTIREVSLKDGSIVKAANFRVAVNNIYGRAKDKQSDQDTMYINVTVWRNRAEAVKQYLHTGSKVYVEGIMQAQLGQDKQGQYYANNVMNANRIEFLSPRRIQETDEMVPPEEEEIEEPAPAPAPKKATPKAAPKAAPKKKAAPATVESSVLPF